MHGVYKETEIKCQLPPDLFLQGPVCFFCRHMIQLEPQRMDLHDFFSASLSAFAHSQSSQI